MPATINEQVVDEVTAVKLQNLASMHSLTAGLSGQYQLEAFKRVNDAANAVHENAMNAAQQIAHNAGIAAQQIAAHTGILSQAMMGRVGRTVLDLSAEQAVAFDKQIAADVASKMQDFGATLASIEQSAKIANNTPRETGLPIEESMLRINASLEAILQRLNAGKP